jgi:CxxC-x17-CxxC domain-containing protein
MKKRPNAKSKPKTKSSVRTQTSRVEQPVLSDQPNLVTIMLKMVERLESLERKMEQVILQTTRQTSAPASEMRPSSQPAARHEAFKPAPVHERHQPFQHQKPAPVSQQHQARRERPLYQIVCADCNKSSEIPFKPTGDRPVYCKECFSKRKNEKKQHQPQHSQKNSQPQPQAAMKPRVVRVTPNGAGKVTVTEMVPSSAPQQPRKNRPARPRKEK